MLTRSEQVPSTAPKHKRFRTIILQVLRNQETLLAVRSKAKIERLVTMMLHSRDGLPGTYSILRMRLSFGLALCSHIWLKSLDLLNKVIELRPMQPLTGSFSWLVADCSQVGFQTPRKPSTTSVKDAKSILFHNFNAIHLDPPVWMENIEAAVLWVPRSLQHPRDGLQLRRHPTLSMKLFRTSA